MMLIFWPGLTLGPSPYSTRDLLNYKSLASYVNFIFGWVRQVLVKVFGDKRVLVAKVSS